MVNHRPVIKQLERLARLHREAPRRGIRSLEVYHRSSIGISARLDTNHQPISSRLARDDGIAVRVLHGTGQVGFASSSGADEQALGWSLARAAERPYAAVAQSWWPEREGSLTDHDPSGAPEADAVAEWLRQAWEELGWSEGVGRVEVARTVESWVADGGQSASRSRTRAWAVAQTRRREVPAILRRPLFNAARTWQELSVDGWAVSWAERGNPSASAPEFSPKGDDTGLSGGLGRPRPRPGQGPPRSGTGPWCAGGPRLAPGRRSAGGWSALRRTLRRLRFPRHEAVAGGRGANHRSDRRRRHSAQAVFP